MASKNWSRRIYETVRCQQDEKNEMTKENYKESFLKIKPELESYLFRLVTNVQDKEDIVQDTYLKVDKGFESFNQLSSFKTWVFAIATNTAKNYLKKKSRWIENAQDYGANLHVQSIEHWDKFHDVFNSTPERKYEIKEHINYCFNCINKTLELNQQICLLLKEAYGFKMTEIISITGLSEGVAKHALADARKNMIRIFDNRCAFVNKNGTCHQCTELTGILNKDQETHIKAKEIKMVKKGSSEDQEYLFDLRLDLVRSIDPLNAQNSIVNKYMLENCEKWVEEGKNKKVLKKSSKMED